MTKFRLPSWFRPPYINLFLLGFNVGMLLAVLIENCP